AERPPALDARHVAQPRRHDAPLAAHAVELDRGRLRSAHTHILSDPMHRRPGRARSHRPSARGARSTSHRGRSGVRSAPTPGHRPSQKGSASMRSVIAASTALALVVGSPIVQAFCGFYVSGSDKKMFNDATNVVLMRSGTRTVLSMQNDYRGPLEDFAMVVPVPVVLKESDVRVVPKAVFDRLD